MSEYVALLINDDAKLGRTIGCEDYSEAVIECLKLAKEKGEIVTEYGKQFLKANGMLVFKGFKLFISELEVPNYE